jgi:hypothetical protein
MLSNILIVLLVLSLVGALPTWPHSVNWGYTLAVSRLIPPDPAHTSPDWTTRKTGSVRYREGYQWILKKNLNSVVMGYTPAS